MSPEPESLILELLRQMRAEIGDVREQVGNVRDQVGDVRQQMATKDDLRSEITSLRADVASDFHTMRKELGEQIVGVRRAVVEYHTTVIGHGVIISELEARLRRVEQHLNLDPAEQH